MDTCLKKSADARKHAIALGPVDYSGDLAGKLLAFSEKMEKVWKKIQDLRTRKVSDESAYENHLNILDDKLTWFEKAEVIRLRFSPHPEPFSLPW